MPHDPVIDLLARATEALEAEFCSLPDYAAEPGASAEAMAQVLAETAHRLGDNYPYFHPLYAGQMLKPPHPVARAAYALAMKINPNNHALDGGRASSAMEMEAVREIAGIFGWKEYLGHLTSGGTFANLEALWMAGQLRPGQKIVGSEEAHYTHQRISAVLKLEFKGVPADERGRMRLDALEDELRKGNVGTVVATLGTTAMGAVDPLHEILSLARRYGARVHVDAAYGGYFRLIADALEEPARRAYAAMEEADSIVIDPHKHGLQPYGCGCVLFKDAAVGRFYKHDSPYTYFTSKELHLGEISLECSRAGAASPPPRAGPRSMRVVGSPPPNETTRTPASRRASSAASRVSCAGSTPSAWASRSAALTARSAAARNRQAHFDGCGGRRARCPRGSTVQTQSPHTLSVQPDDRRHRL